MKIVINKISFIIRLARPEEIDGYAESGGNLLGLTQFVEQEILLRDNLSKIMLRQTLIHELVHAYKFSYGHHINDEEGICDFFASHADEIMKDTDRIMKVLLEKGRKK